MEKIIKTAEDALSLVNEKGSLAEKEVTVRGIVKEIEAIHEEPNSTIQIKIALPTSGKVWEQWIGGRLVDERMTTGGHVNLEDAWENGTLKMKAALLFHDPRLAIPGDTATFALIQIKSTTIDSNDNNTTEAILKFVNGEKPMVVRLREFSSNYRMNLSEEFLTKEDLASELMRMSSLPEPQNKLVAKILTKCITNIYDGDQVQSQYRKAVKTNE